MPYKHKSDQTNPYRELKMLSLIKQSKENCITPNYYPQINVISLDPLGPTKAWNNTPGLLLFIPIMQRYRLTHSLGIPCIQTIDITICN